MMTMITREKKVHEKRKSSEEKQNRMVQTAQHHWIRICYDDTNSEEKSRGATKAFTIFQRYHPLRYIREKNKEEKTKGRKQKKHK